MEAVADSTPQKKLILQTLNGIPDNDEFEKDQLLRIRAKAGNPESVKRLRESFFDEKRSVPDRLLCLSTLAKIPDVAFELSLIESLRKNKSDALGIGMVTALESIGSPSVQTTFLELYTTTSAAVKKRILQALLSRPTWATALLQAYEAGSFPKVDLTPDHARTAAALNDPALTKLVEKHFGKVAPATPGEKLARINSLAAMLKREKPGDTAAGKTVFTKNCAACHQLHGEGAKVGPDLTTADRKNRGYMLTQIVDPSGYIRPEFLNFTINTHDGRTMLGMVAEQSPEAVTLATYLNGKVEKTALKKGDIDTMVPSPVSMMPEKLLDGMNEKEIADLFAYLSSDSPLPLGRGE
jgi:putative heme-binding domain-containing protein